MGMTSWRAPAGVRRAAPPRLLAAARWSAAAVILALVIARTGGEPFARGLRAVSAPLIAFSLVVSALTTLCVATRWRQVTHALGGRLDLATAVGAYYRSQFLNVVLPTGILGDAHRAVGQGRRLGGLGHATRTVVWDRLWGQGVQIVLTCVLLLGLPSPLHDAMPVVTSALLVAIVIAVCAVAWASHNRTGIHRPARALAADVRLMTVGGGWLAPTATSLLAFAGHVGVFLAAMWAAGVRGGFGIHLGLALLVLTAMSVPISIAGWGPREGVAFWAFGAAGLGGSAGVTVTTVYAVLVLCSLAPGAALLAMDTVHSHRRGADASADVASVEGVAHPRLEADHG